MAFVRCVENFSSLLTESNHCTDGLTANILMHRDKNDFKLNIFGRQTNVSVFRNLSGGQRPTMHALGVHGGLLLGGGEPTRTM